MKYDITLTQPKRVEFIKNYLDKYIEKYINHFDDRFNFCPTMSQNLSDKDKVCIELESMANYVLYSPDAPRIQKTKYNFYTEEKFAERLSKDMYINGANNDSADVENAKFEDMIDFLIRSNVNYKREKKQKIFLEDLTGRDKDFLTEIKLYKIDPETNEEIFINSKVESILKGYQVYINYARKNLYSGKFNKYQKAKIKINMKNMKSDQLNLKNMIKRTIYLKSPLNDSTEIDYNMFDFLDCGHVLALLGCKNTDLQSDLGCLVQDLNNILDVIELNDEEKNVLKLDKNGYMQFEIAKTMGVAQPYVNKIIMNIVKKVIKQYYKIYEDWYYLDICRGKYKKCSRCGEIKLATNTYFSPNAKGEYGLYSFCKVCDSDKNR